MYTLSEKDIEWHRACCRSQDLPETTGDTDGDERHHDECAEAAIALTVYGEPVVRNALHFLEFSLEPLKDAP